MTAQTSHHDAPGRMAGIIPAARAHPRPRAAYKREHRASLALLRQQKRISYRELARLTELNLGRVNRALNGKGKPRPADRRRVQQMLRSSEPAFLSAIQRIAVPFLQERER